MPPLKNIGSNLPFCHSLLDRLLAAILLAIASQTLNVRLWSCWGGLAESWIGSLLIMFIFSFYCSIIWRRAASDERQELLAPWLAFFPWFIISLLVMQIACYPPVMNDSLSYRLPRIFTWLQEGKITQVPTADFRMNTMPWGWGAMALPFLSLNLMGWSRLINVLMWMVVYQILCHWTRTGGADRKSSRWLALVLASTTGFILQASSTANDFYAFGLLLIGTHLLLQFQKKPSQLPVACSLLALVLASAVKPQFLVLGLGWGWWWIFGPQRPIRYTPWAKLTLIVPLLILISPIPILWENLQTSHNLMGVPSSQSGLTRAGAPLMMAVGVILFGLSQLQLPVMPCIGALKTFLSLVPGFAYLHSQIPKFSPGFSNIMMIDNASFGLVHSIIFLIGLSLAWRRFPPTRGLCLCAVGCFLLAASQVAVGSIGRSFMGFGAILMPAIAYGLPRLGRSKCLTLSSVAIFSGLFCLIINPSHPLWPCDILESQALSSGWSQLQKPLHTYNSYRERADTGKGILDSVPTGEPVGAIFRSITPLTNLWRPDWRKHRIIFIHNENIEQFNQGSIEWLVVGGKSVEEFPEVMNKISASPQWEVSAQKEYLSSIQQGVETWTLYHKKSR